MTCEKASSLIEPAVEDALDAHEILEFRMHIAECSQCATEFQNAKALLERLESVPVPEPPEDLAQRIKLRVSEEAARMRKARVVGWICGLGAPVLFAVAVSLFFPGGLQGFLNAVGTIAESWWRTAGQATADPSGKGLLARFSDLLPPGLAPYWPLVAFSVLGVLVAATVVAIRSWRSAPSKRQ